MNPVIIVSSTNDTKSLTRSDQSIHSTAGDILPRHSSQLTEYSRENDVWVHINEIFAENKVTTSLASVWDRGCT
jgi:hypothetical protein